MKKFVIFTEGRSELIFLRHVLTQVVGYDHLSYRCFSLIKEILHEIPYHLDNPNASVYYLLINVGTDEKVLSAIIERYEQYLEQGFEVIGLRDMYSERYEKKSATKIINQNINDYFRNLDQEQIQRLRNPERIHLFFAVMEFESWLLGLYNFMERLDPSLTAENINQQLGFNLETIDPETVFFHPSNNLKSILNLANIRYAKHIGDIEGFVSHIMLDDFKSLIESNRCNSFMLLFNEIEREFYDALST